MNQILMNNDKNNISDSFKLNNKIICKKNPNSFYKLIFFSSIILLCLFVFILFIKFYQSEKNEQISKKLTDSYTISTLYSKNTDYTPIAIKETEPFVIGIIKIDKINLNYSILSISNNDLLDISVCRFTGPMPNQVGNLCIAGHNYVDYKFFSRLNELQINDIITIFDINGNKIDYSIYDIYETSPDNISCTFQETKGIKIVTLVTCNNVNGKRLVLHAKEIP